ncbi:MAG: phosphate ABC transporter permease subunit PstC [Phycisphaerales bacterium]|nr:phosphate ABC transporter permease subunit PstC [Phycisphaerales bacterium]
MRRHLRNLLERGIGVAMLICALLSVATTAGIILTLVGQSVPFFRAVPLGEFFAGRKWAPLFEPPRYGLLPLICGTFLITVGALLVAVPIGVSAALFLSECAPRRLRDVLKPVLEILAGVPSVVYGFFALTFLTPNVIAKLVPSTPIFNAASAAIVVGIMIIPTICSLSDDAFRAVPRSLREAGFALSATRFEVAGRIVLPGAASGVVAAILLAVGRAIGETMAVTIAAGIKPTLTLNPFESVQTMTAFIAEVSEGDVEAGTMASHCLFAVGLVLFAITLGVNLVARWFSRRFREVYE